MIDKEIREILVKNIGHIPRRRRKIEKWKPITGFEKLYDVSNTGKVKSRKFTRQTKYRSHAKRKIIKPHIHNGRAFVHLKDRLGIISHISLKMLVVTHWYKKANSSRQVELKDKNPLNCAVSNMRLKK